MDIYRLLLTIFLIEIILISALYRKILVAGPIKISGTSAVNFVALVNIIVMLVVAGFRDKSIGTDLTNYLYQLERLGSYSFSRIGEFSSYYKIEYIFTILEKVLWNLLTIDYMFTFVTAGIILFLLYKYLKALSPNILISLFLFLTFCLYNQSFNIIRQYIAIMIVLCAMTDMLNEKHKKSIVLFVLAICIHKTALVGLLILPGLYFKKNIYKLSFLAIICSSVAAIVGYRALYSLINILGYSRYISRESTGVTVSLMMNCILFAVIAFFSYNREKYYESKDLIVEANHSRLWVWMAAMCLSLNIMAITIPMVDRMMIVFKCSYLVSIPNMMFSIKQKGLRIGIYVSVLVLFTIYYLHSLDANSCYNTVPYASNVLKSLY